MFVPVVVHKECVGYPDQVEEEHRPRPNEVRKCRGTKELGNADDC